jgi:Meckel syndrome type 1 protein
MSTTEGAPPAGNGRGASPAQPVLGDRPGALTGAQRAEPMFGRHPHFCTGCGNPVGAADAYCPMCGRGTGAVTGEDLPALDGPGALGVTAPTTGLAATAPAPPAAAAPPAAPPAPPPAPDAAAGPPARPAWLMPALLGFGAVLAVLLTLAGILWFTGRDSGGGGGGGSAATSGYLRQISADYGLLSRSATAMGNTLATAAAAKDVANINTVARRQLQAATGAYNNLAAMPVAASDRAAQTALVAAAAAQRRYLAALARATSVAPATGLRQVPAIGRAGRETVAAYRRFLALAPGAATAITTAGLADTGGLTAALTARRAFQDRQDAAEAAAAARAAAPPVVANTSSSAGFSSPAGTTFCSAYGDSVVCSSDAGNVAIDQYGAAYSTGASAGGGYGTLPYNTTWTNGSIWCEITDAAGTHCQNPSRGEGYFYIRKQDIRLG